MTKLTKSQEIKRNNLLAQMIERGEISKDDVDRIMSDPVMRRAINAICAIGQGQG